MYYFVPVKFCPLQRSHYLEQFRSPSLKLKFLNQLYRCFPILFFPPFLTCYIILQRSIGGKGLHLRRYLISQPSSDGFLAEGFRGFPQP